MNLPFSLFGLRSAFERECYGTMYHNYASASDIARLLILYRYGGVYLDMDVYFKEYLFDLFGDLDNIGSRLGVLIGRYKWGNGVLAAMPRALALEKCLAEIVKSYTKKETKKNGRLTWYLKRLYGDDRINLTTEITGPLMILKTLGYEGLLLKIQRARYFEHIDASGTAYKERPELPLYLPRRDSLS